jgi:hypothetical protein
MQSKTTGNEGLRWLASRLAWELRLAELREAAADARYAAATTGADHGLAA